MISALIGSGKSSFNPTNAAFYKHNNYCFGKGKREREREKEREKEREGNEDNRKWKR